MSIFNNGLLYTKRGTQAKPVPMCQIQSRPAKGGVNFDTTDMRLRNCIEETQDTNVVLADMYNKVREFCDERDITIFLSKASGM